MSICVEIDRFLQDLTNAVIFLGAYNALDGDAEKSFQMKNLLGPIKQYLGENKLEVGKDRIWERVEKLGQYGLLILTPDTPFSSPYDRGVRLNRRSKDYLEVAENVVRDYPIVMKSRPV